MDSQNACNRRNMHRSRTSNLTYLRSTGRNSLKYLKTATSEWVGRGRGRKTSTGRRLYIPPEYAELDEMQPLDGEPFQPVGQRGLVADGAGGQVPAQRHGLLDGGRGADEQHGETERHVPAVRVERVAHDHVEHDVAEVRGQGDDVEQHVAQRQELILGHGTDVERSLLFRAFLASSSSSCGLGSGSGRDHAAAGLGRLERPETNAVKSCDTWSCTTYDAMNLPVRVRPAPRLHGFCRARIPFEDLVFPSRPYCPGGGGEKETVERGCLRHAKKKKRRREKRLRKTRV